MRLRGESGQALVLLVGAMAALVTGTLILGAVGQALGAKRKAAARRGPRGCVGRPRDARRVPAAVRARLPAARRAQPGASLARRLLRTGPGGRGGRCAPQRGAARSGACHVPGRRLVCAGPGERRAHRARRAARHGERTERDTWTWSRGRRPRSRRPPAATPSPGRRRAAVTAARLPTGRASRCVRTSRSPSTAWRRPPRTTGSTLLVTSGYRSDAEQARAVRRAPRPEVGRAAGPEPPPLRHRARPRPAVRLRLARRERRRFGFLQRYAWEPWHYGYSLNAGRATSARDGRRRQRG